MMEAHWLWVIAGGYVLTWGLIPWILLRSTFSPTSAIAWILAIVCLPYLGALWCVVFGPHRLERQQEHHRESADRIGDRVAAFSPVNGADDLPHRVLARLAENLSGNRITHGNRLRLLPDTSEAIELLEQDLSAASRSIHVEFYIWRNDKLGTRLRELLIRQARQGVEVRFLYDGIGSLYLGRRFLKPMREAGIETASLLPGRTFSDRWSINLRNHRKIVIVDGEIGFTGGMNVGEEYVGSSKAYGEWRDTQIRLEGPAVIQLQQVFAEDWYYSTGNELTDEIYFPKPRATGDVAAVAVADTPGLQNKTHHALLFAAVNEARETVTIGNSYFVPPTPLVLALATAARRGVRVRLLLAREGNFAWTLHAGRSYYDDLLSAGVEIWEYRKGLYHAKTIAVDRSWALVGTTNLDYRSLMLNFEVGIAIHSREIATELERQVDRDLAHADRIDPERWSRRSRWDILKERFFRLFAPIV